MFREKERAWLASLQIGSEVCCHRGFGVPIIDKVSEITPSGRIKVGRMIFNPDGWQRGGDRWHRCFLMPVTTDSRQKAQRERVARLLLRVKSDKIPASLLNEVESVLKKAADETIDSPQSGA